jgi:hypothetical protein
MHNITVYLFNLCLWFISPTCFGTNYAIIKEAASNYIRCALKCELIFLIVLTFYNSHSCTVSHVI